MIAPKSEPLDSKFENESMSNEQEDFKTTPKQENLLKMKKSEDLMDDDNEGEQLKSSVKERQQTESRQLKQEQIISFQLNNNSNNNNNYNSCNVKDELNSSLGKVLKNEESHSELQPENDMSNFSFNRNNGTQVHPVAEQSEPKAEIGQSI